MSDLEDYAYSPYDDLEDILYDADPAPELADDLAEHAVHSPVYLDEIAGYELQDYHSDWEYYTDDYMDDDPALENRDFVEPPTSRKHGKKRKLVDTKDIPTLDLNETKLITRSIKGTVWARPVRTEPPTHNVGQGDRISLMKNWRQVFSIKGDGWGRRTDDTDTDNDESWAKDLGLADMGLQPQWRTSFEQGPVHQQDDDYEEDESMSENQDEGEDGEDINSVTGIHADLPTESIDVVSNSESNGGGAGEARNSSTRKRLTALDRVIDATTIDSSVASEEESPRKRRRLKPEHQTPHDSTETASMQRGNGSVKPTDGGQLNGIATTTTTKKRKASEELYSEHDNINVSDEVRRTKRVAAGSTNGSSARETSDKRSRRKGGSTNT